MRRRFEGAREQKMTTRNLRDEGRGIVDSLVCRHLPYAFGLCSRGDIQFIDASDERSIDIKTISVHGETVAGFMADVFGVRRMLSVGVRRRP